MMQHTGLQPTPAMSNTERQRRFRKRNPGYYGRLHRKRNAAIASLMAAGAAEAQRALPAPAQLLLPAPVEQFLFPDLAQRQAELVPVTHRLATGTAAA
jgi:hypothetical protein